VIGHNHHRVNLEWARFANCSECAAQDFDRFSGGENGFSSLRHQGEEKRAARDKCASILHVLLSG